MGFIYWRARTPCDQTREPFGGVAFVGDEDADRMDANQRAGTGDSAVRECCGVFVLAGAPEGGDACDQFSRHRGEFYVGAGARYGGDVRAVGRQPGGLGGGECSVSAKRNSGDRSGHDVAESSPRSAAITGFNYAFSFTAIP